MGACPQAYLVPVECHRLIYLWQVQNYIYYTKSTVETSSKLPQEEEREKPQRKIITEKLSSIEKDRAREEKAFKVANRKEIKGSATPLHALLRQMWTGI